MAERVFALAVAASDGELVLSWDAPRECPTRAEVLARARERIGDRPSAHVEAAAVITARGQRWRLELTIAGGTLRREIEGGSCEALADAAALVLAMAAAEPVAARADDPPIEAVEPVPPALESRTAVKPTISHAQLLDMRAEVHEAVASRSDYVDPDLLDPIDRIPRVRLAAAGGLDVAGVPGIGGTLLVELGLHWPRTRLVAHGVHAIERRTGDAVSSAAHRMTAAGLGLCRLLPLGRFEIGSCARMEIGRARHRGLRGTDARTHTAMWVAGTLGGTAAWWVAEHWSIGVAIDAVVPLRRYRARLADARVGLVGVVGLRALAGIAVRLP